MRPVSDKIRAMSRALSVILLLGAVAVLTVGCGDAVPDEVWLDSGPIQGIREQVDGTEIRSFKGIPYAAPPVGELRWCPPQPVESWEEPLDCTHFGPACPQPSMLGRFSMTVGRTDEDCLYLNVWSPARSGTERLPVMVWIHGGSLETGAGSMGVYDGVRLAAEGVVVVTINYRLGPLGFLSHPALSAEAATGVSGNYGLMDQIAALEWVQRNISALGGDPGNVTVFGESAGGISILDLIVSPPAQGLFQRAIVESGLLMDQGFGTKMVADKNEAEALGLVFAARLGVDPAGDVAAQMRGKKVSAVVASGSDLADGADDVRGILFWKPVVDGQLLPGMPTELWLAGDFEHVSLLIGSNSEEADLWISQIAATDEAYEEVVRDVFGEHASEALLLYPETGEGGAKGAIGRMLTEVGFASSARFAARQMSASGSDVYLYEFTRAPVSFMGAFHGVELPYVFGTVDGYTWTGFVDETDVALSSLMRRYWSRFAATGDPNGDGEPEWPAYEEDSDIHMELGDTTAASSGLYTDACDLADRVRSGM